MCSVTLLTISSLAIWDRRERERRRKVASEYLPIYRHESILIQRIVFCLCKRSCPSIVSIHSQVTLSAEKTMNENYYLSHAPLHEHNRMVPVAASSSSDYLAYDVLPPYPTEKTPKKMSSKPRQQHHRTKGTSSKSKSQITEKEAKEAIIRGFVTETDDVDVTKLSGKSIVSTEMFESVDLS